MSPDILDIGSIRSVSDKRHAVKLITQGKVIGMKNLAVNALIGDARSMNNEVMRIKGGARSSKPLSLVLDSSDVVPLIDFKRIPESWKETFRDHKKISTLFGALCFLRVPIVKELAEKFEIPSAVLDNSTGNPVIQYWDPNGNSYAEKFFGDIKRAGIKWPGITSYNRTGEKEIVSEDEAIELARAFGIYYLADHKHHYERVKGSYTILGFNYNQDKNNLVLFRHGNIPVGFFESQIDTDISTENAAPAKFSPAEIPKKIVENNPPYARARLLRFLSGLNTHEIVIDELLLRFKLR